MINITSVYVCNIALVSWNTNQNLLGSINPFQSYLESLQTIRFSYSRRFSWSLTRSNTIFATRILPSSKLFWAGKRLVGYLNYHTVLKEKTINRNRKSTTWAICWLKSVLLRDYDFPVPDAFRHVVRTLANR
jgi:hypothetical protein